jgi:hypothetical protein
MPYVCSADFFIDNNGYTIIKNKRAVLNNEKIDHPQLESCISKGITTTS